MTVGYYEVRIMTLIPVVVVINSNGMATCAIGPDHLSV